MIDFALRTALRRGSSLRVVHGWNLPPLWPANPARLGASESEQMWQESRLLSGVLYGWSEK